MAAFTGTALVVIVWQGAVRIVSSKLAKELIKTGAKYLTKKNFSRSLEWFKGNKKLNTSEKNKILEDLNIITPKVTKVTKVTKVPKVPKVPKKEVKKPEKDLLPGIKPGESLHAYYTRMAKESRVKLDKKITKKPEVPKKKVKKPTIDEKAADKGAKIVEEVTKPGILKQTKDAFSKSWIRKAVLPNPIKHPIWGIPVYGTYGYAAYQKNKSLMSEAAKDALDIVEAEEKKKTIADEKKLHKTKTGETTLGEINLNTIASPDGHIWKTDQLGNFIIP